MRGLTYEAAGKCSGLATKPLKDMGYKTIGNADDLAKGRVHGIIPFENVDNARQGQPGVINGYDWSPKDGIIDHVNVGAGQYPGESAMQIIDATQDINTWPIDRNYYMPSNGQKYEAVSGFVNQTYAPFSSRHTPDVQMRIDFSKLER